MVIKRSEKEEYPAIMDINLANYIINWGIRKAEEKHSDDYYMDYYKLTRILFLLNDTYSENIIITPIKFMGNIPYMPFLDNIFIKHEFNPIKEPKQISNDFFHYIDINKVDEVLLSYGNKSRYELGSLTKQIITTKYCHHKKVFVKRKK